jgi:hypothetical protein
MGGHHPPAQGGEDVLTMLFVFSAVTLLTGWLVSFELRRDRHRREVRPAR